jgi:hypothetical protein
MNASEAVTWSLHGSVAQLDQLASDGQSNAESLKSERDWKSGHLNANDRFRESFVRAVTVYSWPDRDSEVPRALTFRQSDL